MKTSWHILSLQVLLPKRLELAAVANSFLRLNGQPFGPVILSFHAFWQAECMEACPGQAAAADKASAHSWCPERQWGWYSSGGPHEIAWGLLRECKRRCP